MAFLSKSDLSISILVDELDEITRDDAAIVTKALSAAEAEAKAWLYDSYDVDAIFTASGSSRHQMVMQVCVDIAIYRIVAAVQAGINMTDRQERYDAAIRWLRMVNKMENYADLPRRAATVQNIIRYGSKTKRNNYI